VVFTLIVDGQPEDIKPVRTIVKNDSSGSQVAVTQKSASPAKQAEAEAEVEVQDDDDLEIGDMLDEDAEGSSIEMDDDPITALESLAGNDDSDDADDIEFFLDDDDDR